MAELSFGTERVSRILLKIAPPVMLAQLIQALYNIVDSFFIGKYDLHGLTALSIVYPIQLLMIALGVGTGVGINTVIAREYGKGNDKKAEEIAGISTFLSIILWVIFASFFYFFMPYYAKISTKSDVVIEYIIDYGRIVCVFSLGLFLESSWSKVIQAHGNMKTPMIAQIIGAVVNIILDPILIFGFYKIPCFGLKGAAYATVIGQFVSAFVVLKKGYVKFPKTKFIFIDIVDIYKSGLPNILMQSAYTFYILGLNLILSTFSDYAVTALGLYYKWQTFFFIPLGALQTCIVPILSFNYGAKNIKRCEKTLIVSLFYGAILMAIGTIVFVFFPDKLIYVFSKEKAVMDIGITGFRIIGPSFIPMVTSLIFPVFFQAINKPLTSSLLTIIRTVVLFVPLGYVFSKFGIFYFWFTYPVTEIITSIVGFIFYKLFLNKISNKRE